MAAPTCKMSIFYNYQARGFSEQFYLNTDPIAAGPAKVREYLGERLKLMVPACQAVYARLSTPQNPRVTTFVDLLDAGYVGKYTLPSADVAGGFVVPPGSAPDDVVALRLIAASGAPGTMHIHAFPATCIKGTTLAYNDPWFTALQGFRAYLAGTLAGFGNWDQGAVVFGTPPRPVRFAIQTLVPAPPRGYTITIPGTGPLPTEIKPGAIINVAGQGALQYGWGGRKVVITVGTQTFLVGGATPIGSPSAGTYFTIQRSNFVPLKSGATNGTDIRGLEERKCGEVFGVPRGRRRPVLPLRR